MKQLDVVSKANKGRNRGVKFRDSMFAVKYSLLPCISFYQDAEDYLMKAMKVMVVGPKAIKVNKESLYFCKATINLVCSSMLIPGK